MAVTWAYDGGPTVTVSIDDAVSGDKYQLYVDDPSSTLAVVTASGSSLTVTVSDMGGVAGQNYAAFLSHGNPSTVDFSSEVIEGNIFTKGTPSVDGTGFAATWAYDGAGNMDVTITAAAGVTYTLVAFGAATGSGDFGPFAAGSTQTLSLPVSTAIPGGSFGGWLYNNDGATLPDFANRIFVEAVASTGRLGNPLAPTPPGPPIVIISEPLNQWRFVVTDLDSATLTFLDRLATDRQVVYTLNAPAVATGRVPSDNPEVNIEHAGEPFVQFSNRLLYGFRREGGSPPWVCRFAGILMQLEDEAASEASTSNFTAYDPWQYLFSRPVLDEFGVFPGPNGLDFDTFDGNDIITRLLDSTNVANGPVRIDWGQTAFYGGTIETTVPVTINFQQGLSVGEAFQQMVEAGYLDIILSPIYDPVNRPGFCCELNIYQTAGIQQNQAIFAWDKPSRSVVDVSRMVDGSRLVNKVRYYAGQGGDAQRVIPPVTQTDAASVTKYGEYWAQQFFPGQTSTSAVISLAQAALAIRKNGNRSLQISPAPERAPDPFNDYFLGDTVPVYASTRMREELSGLKRIYAIPIAIDDNATEEIRGLLLSQDTP